MKKSEHIVELTLSFANLTLDEVASLESYIREGLDGKQWGPISGLRFQTMLVGERSEKKSKKVSKEELLEAEKSKGASCGN